MLTIKRREIKIMRRQIGFCYPGYRYCGPGCSGPGAPTNAVDNCCLHHDACYYYGYDKRYCDALFQHCLSQYKYAPTKMGKDARLFSKAIHIKNNLL